MGKKADLTVVQKTITDSLNKVGKTQNVITKEAGCSKSAVSEHINERQKCGRKRTSQRNDRSLEKMVRKGPFKLVEKLHEEWTQAGVAASRE